MESIILSNLNDEQRIPAMITEGPVLVTAGAGSGKTRMLTHRIAHLCHDEGVKPYNILAITFTNKAANEMRARLEKMIDDANDMWICTFHSMCTKILRREISLLGYTANFSIYTDVEKTRTIKRLLEPHNTNITVETIAWHISNAKNHLIGPDDYASEIIDPRKRDIIISVFKEYESELKKCNALDFDDLLNKTYELFVRFPETLEYYQRKFKYIHVDEFQDTNRTQYEIVKLLAKAHGNVFAVGDEDQCIYSWRGADVTNVQNFIEDFKDVKVFKLEQNYRSSKKILEAANKLIKKNKNRLDKNLWTENDEGTKVEDHTTYSDTEEAEYVASTIKGLVQYSGYRYSDFAVLMRVNSMSRIIEEKLITYGVPYKVYGGFKFFERKEIKDVLSYLRLIHNPHDNEATRRMLTFPKRGIGDATITQISTLAEEEGISMFDLIMGNMGQSIKKLDGVRKLFADLKEKSEAMPLYEFVEYLINLVDFKGAIGNKTDEDLNKQMNIDDFLLSVKEFSDANTMAGLEEYLQSITLMRDIDNLDEEDDTASLITIHAAKGLEFRVVFIVGLNDGLFPLSRAINSDDENELEEERRLMYVAITRAKEKLYLTRSRTRFSFESKRLEYTLPSRFLKELGIVNETGVKERRNYSDVDTAFSTGYSSITSPMDSVYKTSAISSFNQTKTSSQESKVQKKDYSLFKKGTIVEHPHFGRGEVTVEVTDFAAGFVTIKFDKVGIKTLSLKYADLKIVN